MAFLELSGVSKSYGEGGAAKTRAYEACTTLT